jgi:hypothetical protein
MTGDGKTWYYRMTEVNTLCEGRAMLFACKLDSIAQL